MQDIIDRTICVGDILALSTRAGKHDSQIKILCVTEIIEEPGDAYSGTRWAIRGFDGAGMRTQVQKSNNLIVITPMVPFEHPCLDRIKQKLGPDELEALKARSDFSEEI